jgi:acyl-coenzyme A thioesterase PaaI-like protein
VRDSFLNDLGGWYELEGDTCVGEFEITAEMCHSDGLALASILATQSDLAAGALATQSAAPRVPLTVDLTVHRVIAAPVDTYRIVASVLRIGRSTLVTEVVFTEPGSDSPHVLSHATFLPSPNPSHEIPKIIRRRPHPANLAKPFFEQLDVRIVEGGIAELDRTPYTLQPSGTLQGGAIAALVEAAAQSVEAGVVSDLELRYLAAISVGPGRAIATALGGDLVRVEVRDPGKGDRVAAVAMARIQAARS